MTMDQLKKQKVRCFAAWVLPWHGCRAMGSVSVSFWQHDSMQGKMGSVSVSFWQHDSMQGKMGSVSVSFWQHDSMQGKMGSVSVSFWQHDSMQGKMGSVSVSYWQHDSMQGKMGSLSFCCCFVCLFSFFLLFLFVLFFFLLLAIRYRIKTERLGSAAKLPLRQSLGDCGSPAADRCLTLQATSDAACFSAARHS